MNAKRMLATLGALVLLAFSASAVQIVSVDWNAGLGVIEVGLDSFATWGGGGGLAWDGSAFWVPGGPDIQWVSK